MTPAMFTHQRILLRTRATINAHWLTRCIASLRHQTSPRSLARQLQYNLNSKVHHETSHGDPREKVKLPRHCDRIEEEVEYVEALNARTRAIFAVKRMPSGRALHDITERHINSACVLTAVNSDGGDPINSGSISPSNIQMSTLMPCSAGL